MLTYTRNARIEWGDCDPAGIVFFPRYFAMFDSCTTALFSQALGMSKYQFTRHYDFQGYPMVDTKARFLKPTKFGDDVVIETQITAFRRSSFDVQHRITLNGELCVECFDTRVWAKRDPANPEAIKSEPVPQEVIDKFNAELAVERDAVLHVEAGAAELRDLRFDHHVVAELRRFQKPRPRVHHRIAFELVVAGELILAHAQRLREQRGGAAVEHREIARKEHDARRVAIAPLDAGLSSVGQQIRPPLALSAEPSAAHRRCGSPRR